MIAVLLGPPGVGKGTQARMLCDAHGWVHISSGDVLRREAALATPRGAMLQDTLTAGQLVPDDLTLQIILDHILRATGQGGVLLDGFPRTVPQAVALDDALASHHRKVDVALVLKADTDQLAQRFAGRLTCKNCGAVYHTEFHPPKAPGICDRCSGPLYHRADDEEGTVRNRMAIYFRDTEPLIDYYDQRQRLEPVDGSRSIDDVYQALDDVVRGVKV